MHTENLIKDADIRRKGHWLLGSTLDFASGTLKFVEECIRDYPGGIVHSRIAFKDFFLLLKPDYITQVLQKNHRNYRKSFAYDGLKPYYHAGDAGDPGAEVQPGTAQ